jgi:hypothetical protein
MADGSGVVYPPNQEEKDAGVPTPGYGPVATMATEKTRTRRRERSALPAYRFNRRERANLFLVTLARVLDNIGLPYSRLTAES